MVLPQGAADGELAEVARDPPASNAVGVDEAVGAQVQRRSESVGVEGHQAEFDRTLYAKRRQCASELLGSYRHPEHEDSGEHSRRRHPGGSGEGTGCRHPLATVKGAIRLVPPQPGEGVDTETGGEEIGPETGYRFGVHPTSQLHAGQAVSKRVEFGVGRSTALVMTNFGYALMTEQSGPSSSWTAQRRANASASTFEVSSDLYSPWCTSQGHTPRAWAPVEQRQDMLAEAITIIRELHTGDLVSRQGDYFRIDSTRIWGLPDQGVPIVVAVPGEKSIARFAPPGDHLITTEPRAELLASWAKVHDGPSRSIGQSPICRGADKEAAIAMAHHQFRWFGGGWAVNTDLPTPAGFESASQFVRPEDVAESIPCGPDLDELADAVREYAAAGFTDVAPVQVGAAN